MVWGGGGGGVCGGGGVKGTGTWLDELEECLAKILNKLCI